MIEALTYAAVSNHGTPGIFAPLTGLLVAMVLLAVATMAFQGFLEHVACTLLCAVIGGILSTQVTPHHVLHLRPFAICAGAGLVAGVIISWRWARWMAGYRQRSSPYPFIGGE